MKRIHLLAMAALLLAAPVAAARAEQKAYSVPISEKIVRLEVQVPDGHWIKAMVQEGDQLRIEDHSLNLVMAFVPVIKNDKVRIRAFRVEKHAGGDESMHFVEDIDARVGDTGFTKKAAGAFAIKVVGVVMPSADGVHDGMPSKSSCKPSGNAILANSLAVAA